MGNNAEIRQRMNTYRSILLAINWIVSIIVTIGGFVLIDTIGGYAAIIIIVGIILGIIGHFLINVALAIPFILLNNGDILESIKKNEIIQGNSSNDLQNNVSNSSDWVCNKCNHNNRNTALFCNSCGEKR